MEKYINPYTEKLKDLYRSMGELERKAARYESIANKMYLDFLKSLKIGDTIEVTYLAGHTYRGTVVRYLMNGIAIKGVTISMEYSTGNLTENEGSVIQKIEKHDGGEQ